MTPDRTAAAIQARRRASEHKLQQVRDAISKTGCRACHEGIHSRNPRQQPSR